MYLSCTLLSVLIGGIFVNAHGSSISDIDGAQVISGYDELNLVLVRKTSSTDMSENMGIAREELSRQQTSGNVELVRALRLFTALSTLNSFCSSENLNVIKQNDKASNMRAHKVLDKKTCYRRVEKVLIQYATKYTKTCQYFYPELFYKKLLQLNKERKAIIGQLVDYVAEKHASEFNEEKIDRFHRLARESKEELPELQNNYFLLDVLRHLVQKNAPAKKKYFEHIEDEVSGLMVLNGKEFDKMFTEYLIEPCRSLVFAIDSDLISEMEYFSSWRKESKIKDRDYYLYWLGHKICSKLTSNESKLLEEVRTLASSYFDGVEYKGNNQ